MATIFPTSPSPQVNDEYQGYRYNGTSWDIIGIDLTADYQPKITGVSDTEIGYLDGVTSAIQTQLNSKQATVSGVSDTEIGYLDGVTSAIQTQLNAKQGTVSGVSDTEIGYLDGVTSAIQTQLDSKLSSSTAASTYQPLVSGVSNTEIGYLDGVTSAIQTQINAKSSLSGATFTGNITAPEVSASTKLVANTVGGDEGGEILLGKPATNTTLTGTGVTIDVFQNRLRIFEQGGDARGVSIDISNTSNGVGTELTPGLGGVPFRMAAGIATVGSNSPVSVTFPASRFSVAPVVTVTGNSGWAWISNLTSTGVVVYQTTSWGGASQAGSMYWTAVQMTSGAAGG